MVYDNAGNITRVDIYSLGSNWAPVKLLESRTYTYGDTNWCDKLIGYNGTAITYDAVGNPLAYRDSMTMSWQNGRQLASLQTADNSVTYKYDNNGMRTRKSDSNGTTNYYYDSSNNLIGLTKGNNTLLFYYNPSGDVTSFKYNGEMYYYIKNLQGDIVKIIDQSGAEAASYKYDSWGKITAESGDSVIRELNPFRYRGYVYDTETGLYYLQSRYYDPITGRFLNADIYCDTQSGTTLSTNMFAYCENNAITYVDDTGTYNIKNFNCYSYAVGVSDRWLCPGTRGRDVSKAVFRVYPPYSVEQLAKAVSTDLFGLGIMVRRLKSKNDKLGKGEYLIALRVAKYPELYTRPNINSNKYYCYDFHFMKKDPKTGKWWTKSGKFKIICKGKINPDNKSNWAMPADMNYKKVVAGFPARSSKIYKVYYNSHTEYLAVKTRFWTK